MKKDLIILGTAHLDTTPGKQSPDGKFREDILKNLKSYRKEYSEIDYLDREDINEVLNYLDKLIQIINNSFL